MRFTPAVVACLVAGLAGARAEAAEWTLIDVRAHILNDGRVEVVETHHLTLPKTGDTMFRDFGLGTDQQIVLHAVTRTGPDGEPHRLAAVENVLGPDQFRYYGRGHVYFSIPPLGDDVALVYRFEYELVNGVTPAWGMPSGEASWEPDDGPVSPWTRVAGLIDGWREAVRRGTTWRFDQDVLMPSRAGSGHTVRRIDYRLEYDSAWRQTAPEVEVGHAIPDDRYRAMAAFTYLGTTPPATRARDAALIRAASLAAMPVLGGVAWLLAIGLWQLAGRRAPIDRAFVDTRFLSRTPEELACVYDRTPPRAEALLNRLVGQGALQAQALPEPDDPDVTLRRVRLRLLAPAETLAPLEREVVEGLFGGSRETDPDVVAQRYRGREFDPQAPLERVLAQVNAKPPRGGWSWLAIACALAAIGGVVFALTEIDARHGEAIPVLGMAFFAGITLVAKWPKDWWFPGRSTGALLVPLVLLTVLALAMQLILNRPIPPLASAGVSLAVVAAFVAVLLRSRAPERGPGRLAADVQRMRRFARRELTRPRPQLEDGWIPRLRAIGLAKAIDQWRATFGHTFAPPSEPGGAVPITTARFTGLAPAAWDGPSGWLYHYFVGADDEDDEDTDDEAAGDGPDEAS
jgi:hypothetical protein